MTKYVLVSILLIKTEFDCVFHCDFSKQIKIVKIIIVENYGF